MEAFPEQVVLTNASGAFGIVISEYVIGALLSLAARCGVPFRTYSAEELNALPGEFSGSDFVKGVTGVDCVSERAALLAAGAGAALVRKKTAGEGMTFALAEVKEDVSFG